MLLVFILRRYNKVYIYFYFILQSLLQMPSMGIIGSYIRKDSIKLILLIS